MAQKSKNSLQGVETETKHTSRDLLNQELRKLYRMDGSEAVPENLQALARKLEDAYGKARAFDSVVESPETLSDAFRGDGQQGVGEDMAAAFAAGASDMGSVSPAQADAAVNPSSPEMEAPRMAADSPEPAAPAQISTKK
ncbi:MAG: hypothetical protein KJ904_01240 [Alphaproteobacteria bacterium]|nr:hypothetical protein [Alphaproteobacteria bacterium]MBU0796081.1 hypothetical protein [Alphaproteobacteria bacterium]MBU0885768.1 hypothetical protein [Alphaproteobacteria bacterium]MBU1814471.1 hypothetical protein [Alphaproteobacteria bacterium]MBU2091012.1 hypothetical protein [Alphaproteobacteria bacterium]